MTVTTEYVRALDLVRALDRSTRAQLVAQVVQELVETDDQKSRSDRAWQRLNALRAEFTQLGPISPSPAEQLERDRAERSRLLEGSNHD